MSSKRLFPLTVPAIMVARILLVVLVLTSSLAWLPPAAYAAPQASPSAAPSVNARIVGNRLFIEARDLPSKHVLVVRARLNSDDKWTKLTKVQSNRSGALSKRVRLSKDLLRASSLFVCLKDKKAGEQYCTKAFQE